MTRAPGLQPTAHPAASESHQHTVHPLQCRQGANSGFVAQSASICSIASNIALAVYPSAVVIIQLHVHRSVARDWPP
jgi:hypothetical protein